MPSASIASAVRPGEHACARLGRIEDHQVLATAFTRHGLDGGHRVLWLGDDGFCTGMREALQAADVRGEPAVAGGQLVLRPACDGYLPDGSFDADRMIGLIREEHAAALKLGYAALSVTGDMSRAYDDPPGTDALLAYERRLNAEPQDTLLMLCRYDQAHVALSGARDVTAQHAVDIGPELVALSRIDNLAAAWAGGPEPVLRLAGELDYTGAEALRPVLAAHLHGPLVVDLGDVEFADVAGMRALRGRKGQPLRITAASPPVRRLLALMGWDTDPAVDLA
jgi:anti-anti-sigma factor